jgi:hypothetical protein
VYDRLLTAGEIAAVRAYLLTRYAYEFDPLSVASSILWLRSDQGITLNGSNVSGWLDGSPEANHATQIVALRQPAYGASSGVNGTPGVTFDAANTEGLDLGVLAYPSNDWTVFGTVNQGASTGAVQALFGTTTITIHAALATVAAESVGGFDSGWQRAGLPQLGDQWLEWHWSSAGTSLTTYRNGAPLGIDATTAGVMPIAGSAGVGYYPGALFPANATVSELIVYDRLLTTEETTALRGYHTARYSLP